MPCYSYFSNTSVTAGNIEIVYAASGNTYSYNNLFWVCEFPVSGQIIVYTRPDEAGPETLRVQGTHYNINGTDIVFTGGYIPSSGQVVIRRTTPTDKMLFVFNDGAKLTAEQLNGAFHQLLFGLQEKDLAKSTTNYIYTISATVGAWSNATPYVIGNLVTENNSIYRCIQNHTNQNPSNAAYWSLVNPSQAGFVLTGNNAPISVNVSTLSPGKALVWNGAEFAASTFTGYLDDLTDVNAGNPNANQLLRYNNNSQWVPITPTFDITQANILFNNRAFYDSANVTTSYTGDGSQPLSAPSPLNKFKNAANHWVLTDPPTVYHILSELTPGTATPEAWFENINTQVNNLSQTLSNPVKAKLYWNLRTFKTNTANDLPAVNTDTLDNYKTLFYDSPEELYSVVGYDTSQNLPITFHGVVNNSIIYKDNPYYYRVSGNPGTFKSKIEGYGIKNFYLSVPECRSSNFIGLPITTNNDLFVTPAVNDIQDGCNALGGPTSNQYRDYYLQGLREMAFGANFSSDVITGADDNEASTDYKKMTQLARYHKAGILRVNYNWGTENTVNFKRLEDSAQAELCLWKIPKQIIYYNKAAFMLAVAPSSMGDATKSVANETEDLVKQKSRFTGRTRFEAEPGNNYPHSTLTKWGNGTLFKGESFWTSWVNRWSLPDNSNKENYEFMSADFDWLISGVNSVNATTSLFADRELAAHNAFYGNYNPYWTSATFTGWPFRPLVPRTYTPPAVDLTSVVGITNIIGPDKNVLFSQAINFIPDPHDEYVYRVVLNKDLTPVFKQNNIPTLKSSIILEYGFSEKTNNRLTTALSGNTQIFPSPSMPAENYRGLNRLKESDILVYVKSENIEVLNNIERVVITIGIKIPRLKSIGYARVFRQILNSSNTVLPIYKKTNNTVDNESDLGAWSFGSSFTSIELSGTPSGRTPVETVSDGRNEAAVKFTRLGIPSTLWIRLSVLNTNASYDLINANGFINTEPV